MIKIAGGIFIKEAGAERLVQRLQALGPASFASARKRLADYAISGGQKIRSLVPENQYAAHLAPAANKPGSAIPYAGLQELMRGDTLKDKWMKKMTKSYMNAEGFLHRQAFNPAVVGNYPYLKKKT
jgi:hypothetical protein